MDADVFNFKMPAMQETQVQFLGWEDPLEEGKATHYSILAWRIPSTLQSVGLQRVGRKLTNLYTDTVFAKYFLNEMTQFSVGMILSPTQTWSFPGNTCLLRWAICGAFRQTIYRLSHQGSLFVYTSSNYIHTLVFNYSTCFRDA